MTPKPKRKKWVLILILLACVIVAAGVGFVLAMGVTRVNQESLVKDELITQNARLRTSMKDDMLQAESIIATKSTEKVDIRLQVSSDYKTYCIDAKLRNSKSVITYHMFKETPDLEPLSGLCGETATEKPSQPSGVSLGSAGSNSASLTWPAVPGASGYELECSLGAVSGSSKKASTKLTQGTVEGLTAGATYDCRVAAKNSLGLSDWSEKVSVATKAETPVPKDLKISTVSQTSLSYSWTAVPNAREYILEYASDTGFTQNTKKITTKDTRGTITGLEKYKGYFFQVKAITNSTPENLTPFSAVVQGRTAE